MEHLSSLKNQKVQQWRSLKERKGRRETGCFMVEGRKMVEEAIASRFPVEAILADAARIGDFDLPGDIPLYTMPEHVLAAVCDTKTPQGIAAVVRMVNSAELGDKLVAMDGVQDPGNVGTILRTLDAFDFDGLLLLEGCADPWSVKTVRASMGAVFRRSVWCLQSAALPALLERSGLPLYGTALREDTEDVRAVSLDRCAIAIGSEGQGLSAEVLAMCQKTLKIPMSERCESLNAAIAAAVLLWESYR